MSGKITDEDKPDWQQLEHLVVAIQKQLAPDAKVEHNVKLKGIHSETERQIDVLVEQSIGQYTMRIVIDCKDHSKPVDVKGVEEFHGLVQDVGAHKGALVCPSGFSSAAKNRAKKLQIDLYSPVDTNPHKWQVKISAPVLCDFRSAYMSFKISYSQPNRFALNPEFYSFNTVFDENKEGLCTALEAAQHNWNEGKYPVEPGIHKDLDIFSHKTLIDNYFGELVEVQLSVSLRVKQQLYIGHLPIEEIRGLKDEHTGYIVTNAFTTGVLDHIKVQNQWQKIEKDEALDFQPLFRIYGLHCYGSSA